MKPNDRAIEAARKVVIQRATHNFFNPIFLFGVIEAALDAAYAAQFQSEDYADVIKSLRVMHDSIITDAKEQFRDGIHETMPSKAADALEALLAEREAWKGRQEATAEILKQVETERDALKAANNELREENELVGKQMDKFADQIESLETERDALAAHLAPVDDDILREIAAMHFARIDGHSDNWDRYVDEAKDYIDAIRPHIEAAERERCAKAGKAALLKSNYGELHADANYADELGEEIAAAIRSGK